MGGRAAVDRPPAGCPEHSENPSDHITVKSVWGFLRNYEVVIDGRKSLPVYNVNTIVLASVLKDMNSMP